MLRYAASLPVSSTGQAYCDVCKSTPHSSGFARLASGSFYEVVNNCFVDSCRHFAYISQNLIIPIRARRLTLLAASSFEIEMVLRAGKR